MVSSASQRIKTIPERGVVRSREPFTFCWAATISLKRLQVKMSIVLCALNLGEQSVHDKSVMVIGHQFITLTVCICVQQGECEAPYRTGLSAAAETCISLCVSEFQFHT